MRLQYITNLVAAIEKCLENGVGACLAVDDRQRYVDRITLSDISHAVLEGGLLMPTLGQYLKDISHRFHNVAAMDQSPLQPVLNEAGTLVGTTIDGSLQHVSVAQPNLTRDDFRFALSAFISSWISSKGPYLEKFESEFCRVIGTEHGLSVSNGTVALHLALLALDIGPGDEVIVPDLTFAATINVVLYCGATPVVVDVDRRTWWMSLETVRRACTSRTKAIIPVHLYGRPAEVGPIAAFASKLGIAVVEDCAEAHGALYDGRPVGQFGDISCFSFFANKIVTTGEGGMCLTNSAELARSMRLLRDHGMTPGRAYWHERVGYNYRTTNLQAAVGYSQVLRLDDALTRNQAVADLYSEALKGIPGVRFPPPLDAARQPGVWLSCVLVPAKKRDILLKAAGEAGLEMRPFFHPLSSLPPYKKFARVCPNSIELSATALNLPTSRVVDSVVVDRVSKVFRDVLG